MAYIGTPPNQQLRKITSQSFNGDGSTTVFTLNRSVDNGESLEVFVDNVQQEPGTTKSYTAAGTSLTFSEAPQTGTGNVYVIYRGVAEVTTRLEHDPNQALQATTGTFSSDLTVDTDTLYVDSTNNRVGINTVSPSASLNIEFSNSGNASVSTSTIGTSSVILNDTDTGGGYRNLGLVLKTGAGEGVFYGAHRTSSSNIDAVIGTNDTERLRILSSGGITFNGDTAAANVLDGYETGSWTPVVSGATTAGTGTYSSQNGSYVKVGNLINLSFDYALTAHTGSGFYRLSGLPYASTNTAGFECVGTLMLYNYNTSPALGTATLYLGKNQTTARFYVSSDNAAWVQQSLDTAHNLIGTITYRTD